MKNEADVNREGGFKNDDQIYWRFKNIEQIYLRFKNVEQIYLRWPNIGHSWGMNFPNGPIDVPAHIQPLLQTHQWEFKFSNSNSNLDPRKG